MAIVGTLLKNGIRLRESLEQSYSTPFELQKRELKKLLIHSRDTAFGEHYDFEKLLRAFRSQDAEAFYDEYRSLVPIHDYNSMYNQWWHRCKQGEKNVCWPGKVKYFALSSGTSEASSKYIPITSDMLKAIRKTSMRQILTLGQYDLPPKAYETGILMLGGSTHLNKEGSFFSGDLSGITTGQIPFWFQHWHKPGKKISSKPWDSKLDEIAERAPDWNVGFLAGVPAWIQIMMQKVIDRHGLDTIHDAWPNLQVYVHGGVAFAPYKPSFEKLLARPLTYMDTYLASEGFVAFQSRPQAEGMRLVLNNGIFQEFVPFTEENFDADGQMKEGAQGVMVHQTEQGKEYAVLLTTCAGAYRYLIGDTVKVVDKERSEIIITGRTKHFLSLCGEHLSVDNMNHAIKYVSDQLGMEVSEFTVVGERHETLFAHHWFLGTDQPEADKEKIYQLLDDKLMELNDDYRVERAAALKAVQVTLLPVAVFYDFMDTVLGKQGGQSKFPRVLRGERNHAWRQYLQEKNLLPA